MSTLPTVNDASVTRGPLFDLMKLAHKETKEDPSSWHWEMSDRTASWWLQDLTGVPQAWRWDHLKADDHKGMAPTIIGGLLGVRRDEIPDGEIHLVVVRSTASLSGNWYGNLLVPAPAVPVPQ